MNSLFVLDKIDEVNRLIKKWDDTCNIFDGGCVFVAACVSKHLEELSIPYKVIYYILPGTQSTDIHEVVKEGFLCHVTIEMSFNIAKKKIGYSIDHLVDDNNLTRKTCDMSSEELYALYDSNVWNGEYDPKNNEKFESEVDNIFNK